MTDNNASGLSISIAFMKKHVDVTRSITCVSSALDQIDGNIKWHDQRLDVRLHKMFSKQFFPLLALCNFKHSVTEKKAEKEKPCHFNYHSKSEITSQRDLLRQCVFLALMLPFQQCIYHYIALAILAKSPQYF